MTSGTPENPGPINSEISKPLGESKPGNDLTGLEKIKAQVSTAEIRPELNQEIDDAFDAITTPDNPLG